MSINLKDIQKYIDMALEGLEQASEELSREKDIDIPQDENVVVVVVRR